MPSWYTTITRERAWVTNLDMLIGIAQERGLAEFYGFVQPGNKKMLRACDRLGMTGELIPDGLVRVKLQLK